MSYNFVSLKNRHQVLQELTTEDPNAHDLWKGTRDALTETWQEVLGPKKNQHKDWIAVNTLEKTQARRFKKETNNESRTRAKQGGNPSRVYRSQQGSERERKERQERLHRQPGGKSKRSSLPRQHERPVHENQEAGQIFKQGLARTEHHRLITTT